MIAIKKDDLEQVWALINASHVVLKRDTVFEIYHHMGENHFRKVGAVFINIVNKEYSKSYAIMLPGQMYPDHYHKIKIETFFVVYGELQVVCNGKSTILSPGDLLSIERGQDHRFYTDTGVVFEELSTTYLKNDSVYLDERIQRSTYDQRKTLIPMDKFKEMIMT